MKVENGKLKTENGELSPLNSVIQFEMGTYDYCLSEIARIVEENDAKILGLTVESIPEDPGRIVVSILVNKVECTTIIKSFYRYNYNIINVISSPDENNDLLDRYSLLMRYMNI